MGIKLCDTVLYNVMHVQGWQYVSSAVDGYYQTKRQRMDIKVLKERKPIEPAKEIDARFNTNFCDGEYCGFCYICLSIFKHIRFDGSIRQKANLQSNISVVAAATFGTQRVNIAAINKHISAFFMF